jgi:hypothetical protein
MKTKTEVERELQETRLALQLAVKYWNANTGVVKAGGVQLRRMEEMLLDEARQLLVKQRREDRT